MDPYEIYSSDSKERSPEQRRKSVKRFSHTLEPLSNLSIPSNDSFVSLPDTMPQSTLSPRTRTLKPIAMTEEVLGTSAKKKHSVDLSIPIAGYSRSRPQESESRVETSSLFRNVSILRKSNSRIVEEIDHLVALVSSDSSLTFTNSSSSYDSVSAVESLIIPSKRMSIGSKISNGAAEFEAALKAQEERLAKEFDQRLQLAISVARQESAHQLAEIEASCATRIAVERQAANEKVDAIRKAAILESNERVANLTKMLVQNISHEMRTPLNVITTGLHVIEEHLLDEDELKEDEEVISTADNIMNVKVLLEIANDLKQSCKDCNLVLDDIILYESIKLGELVLVREKISVHSLVKIVLREYASHAKMCNINLLLECMRAPESEEDDGPTVSCDKSKLRLVFDRYLASAIHFTPAKGTVTVRVLYLTRSCLGGINSTQGVVRIEFIDTGGGIDRGALKSLFHEEWSESLSNSVLVQGGGLRMWVCKEIIELLGGITGVTSPGQGRGTTFYIEIPSSWENSPSDAILYSSPVDSFLGFADIVSGIVGRPFKALRKAQYKILIVDDVASCRKMHARLFADYSRDSAEACDGVECIDMAVTAMKNDQPFDAVILDNSMPNLSGPDAAYQLRKNGYKGKIFGVTGNARDEDIEDFLVKGADKVFLKPLNADAINSIVSELNAVGKSRWVIGKMRRDR